MNSPPESAADLLTPSEAASLLRTSKKTLAVWRCVGRHGIPFIRIGRKILYSKSALGEYIDRKTISGER